MATTESLDIFRKWVNRDIFRKNMLWFGLLSLAGEIEEVSKEKMPPQRIPEILRAIDIFLKVKQE